MDSFHIFLVYLIYVNMLEVTYDVDKHKINYVKAFITILRFIMRLFRIEFKYLPSHGQNVSHRVDFRT